MQEISRSEVVVYLVLNCIAFCKTDTKNSVEGEKLILTIKPTGYANFSNLFLE